MNIFYELLNNFIKIKKVEHFTRIFYFEENCITLEQSFTKFSILNKISISGQFYFILRNNFYLIKFSHIIFIK